MKIPFSIKYKPQIESGEYKVVTGDDRPVKIVCWDKKVFGGRFEIVGLVPTHQGDTETVQLYCPDGTHIASSCRENFKLFIITPEPELSEFEKALEVFLMNADSSEETFHEEVKKHAAELLALAREQFIKDGYVIEKKAFHDAVEKVAPEVMKEVSDKVDMEEAFRLGYENGRADALKDLPRWRKWENGAAGNSDGHPIALVSGAGGIRFVSALGITGEKYIMLADLEKLPGFKED